MAREKGLSPAVGGMQRGAPQAPDLLSAYSNLSLSLPSYWLTVAADSSPEFTYLCVHFLGKKIQAIVFHQ